MHLPIAFDGRAASHAEVGGKAASLMRLTRAGLAIPPGFTLPVGFFDAWREAVAQRVGFAGLATDPVATGSALKLSAAGLAPSPTQIAAVDDALSRLPAGALLAVRSSSPDEDLEAASFAGGYETVLGVSRDRLWLAIQRAFASCFDARVATYKLGHGIDPTQPRIAIVVQQQVAAEIAGVGFSIDPITHDSGVAFLNANWGLGDSVVSGLATPDEIRVDKASRRILAHHVGAKETAVRVRSGGGTEEYDDPRRDQPCLDAEQIAAVVAELERIERLYERPVDVEWAWAGGRLYVLQARPVTTVKR